MHILIGLITAIAGLIWALNRLQDAGVNLNALNPFFWMRRRAWERKVGTKPLHRLEQPYEAAAVLLVGIAKLDGEVSREQKKEIILLFNNEFKLSNSAAAELYSASSYLLQDVVDLSAEVKKIFVLSKDKFNATNVHSLIDMLNKVASMENAVNEQQERLIEEVKTVFNKAKIETASW